MFYCVSRKHGFFIFSQKNVVRPSDFSGGLLRLERILWVD
nr:MAG TPA: hypothetical protein [Caudoviricetes sp.]